LTGLDRLALRLQALEDERDVRATLYRYGHALDYGAEDDWVDCFAVQAHYEVRQRPGETVTGIGPGGAGAAMLRCYDGRDELATFAARHTRAPERFHKHLLVDPVIAVDGDHATAVSYFVRLDDVDGEPVVYAFGRYRDELVRCGDGQWRFAVRIAEIESRHLRWAPRRGEPGA
jgi:3-phenylpropionate/cinnamic acid dioxygenase small subunit